MKTIKINIKKLLDPKIENIFSCPFNKNVIRILIEDKSNDELFDKIYDLYEETEIIFSSPGNSFRRNLSIELNAPFQIAWEDSKLKMLLNNDSAKLNEYNLLFSQLSNKAKLIKHRIISPLLLNKILRKKEDEIIQIHSTELSKTGIYLTLNSFIDLNESLINSFKIVSPAE